MWFTLFHEIGHVLLHSERELFLNSDANAAEDEANEFAAQLLVPTEFNMEIPRGRNIEAVKALASKLGIAPSIVLGRAQRETRDFAWGHGLRRSGTVEQLNC